MNLEEFEKTKKELEEAKKQNDEQIAISDERTRMAKVNSLEYKGGITLMFSMLAYIALLFTSLGLTKSLGAGVITNIFPGFTYPIALIGGSLGIGVIGRVLFDNKFKVKERLKAFSTAKTQTEKLEEEVYYQIELEKANNRNKAIDESIKVLNLNQTMLSRISSRYDLNDKTAPHSKEEAEKKAEELSAIIKEQYEKLDILSTQKVLHDRFWKIRQKFQRRTETMMAPMLSGMFTMFFWSFPTIFIKDIMPSGSLLTTLAVPFAPLVAGVVGGSAYMLKRNSNYKKVFNNLNAQLGENALVETYEQFESAYEEQQELESLIANQIRDIIVAEVRLQENKRYLDTFVTEEEKKEEVLFKDFPQLHITEETKKDVLQHPERYVNCDARTRMSMFYTDEEREKYIEDSLSRHLPGGEEKGPTLVKK